MPERYDGFRDLCYIATVTRTVHDDGSVELRHRMLASIPPIQMP